MYFLFLIRCYLEKIDNQLSLFPSKQHVTRRRRHWNPPVLDANMSLEALPEELLVRITKYLEKGDIAKLTLLNTRLQRIATGELFRSITLYAHWRHEREDDDSHSVDTHSVGSAHNEGSDTDGPTHEPDYALDLQKIPDDEPEIDYTYTDRMFFSRLYRYAFLGHGSPDHHRPPPGFEDISRPEDMSLPEDEWPFLDAFLSYWRRRDGFLDPLYIPTNAEGSAHFELFYTFMKSRMELSKEDWQKIPKPKWAKARFPGPLGYDAQSFLNVLQHDSIKRCVQEVQVYTCETHCVGHLMKL